ncbi:MAG: LysM peptidoglycan-binding domain-containing protein [Bacteroidales bacterium]|nr:LysM peptidoglycan-binding domain-containing protein [Bacteroidales bacterium]
MKTRLITAILLVLTAGAFSAAAQDYQVPPVKISQDKVRVNGKSYYAHVVTEKQTLFSISKAYNVSLQDIYDANKNLDLENAGLKTGQVIFIPTQPSAPAASTAVENTEEAAKEAPAVSPAAQTPAPAKEKESSALERWLYPGKFKTAKPAEPEQPAMPADSVITAEPADTIPAFELDIPERIKVAVVLPYTSSRLSDNTVDFYSGVLLAARDLGKSGLAVDIDAIDIKDSSSLSKSSFKEHDIIIGPITSKAMQVLLDKCPRGKMIISPLDPQAYVLSADQPSIQAPTPTATQNQDIVHWALQDMAHGDSLVLITSKGAPLSEGSKSIVDELKASGARYHTISYGILEGLSIQDSFEAHCSANGVTRYIIAADDESFVNDAVRNVNLMLFKKHNVALYAPSRIRSFNMIETEYLHSVNTHISAAYFTDFNDKNVSNFIMAYRALFNVEPNQFAFHGYDTMHYFLNICRTYGRHWPKVLQDYGEHGLQTDFRFVREDGAEGFVNTAVRRVIYTPDFQIKLQ